jgi:hypothetical protein
MRYIVIAALAVAAFWMLEGNSRPQQPLASPTAATQIDDMGRIVIIGHRNAS